MDRPAGDYADLANCQGDAALSPGFPSSGGRRSAVEGDSPNSERCATAKRPSSQKPYLVAISVTVVVSASAFRRPAARGASAATTDTASGSSRDAPDSNLAASDTRHRPPCRAPSYREAPRSWLAGHLPGAASPPGDGGERCACRPDRRPPGTKPSLLSEPARLLSRLQDWLEYQARFWQDGQPFRAGSTAAPEGAEEV